MQNADANWTDKIENNASAEIGEQDTDQQIVSLFANHHFPTELPSTVSILATTLSCTYIDL